MCGKIIMQQGSRVRYPSWIKRYSESTSIWKQLLDIVIVVLAVVLAFFVVVGSCGLVFDVVLAVVVV